MLLFTVLLPNPLYLLKVGITQPGQEDDDDDDNEEDPANTNTDGS